MREVAIRTDVSPEQNEELEWALQSMANGKAPGIDGLPAEFYKAFWDVVGEDLLAMLNDSLVGGQLPLSCRRASLTLLPKKGDLSEAKNWRPEVMGQVTHADQACCVPGRSILNNISLVRDVLEVADWHGLISLDQEKAFDRVEHQYLWDTFGAFGFSPGFVSMVRVLYCNIESVLKELSGVQLAEDLPRFYVAAYADDVVVGVTGDSCEVTLNPNTAHRFLSLSDGNKKVEYVGYQSDLHGYRPVALTSYLMKALERLVLTCLHSLVGSAMEPAKHWGGGAIIYLLLFTLYTADFTHNTTTCHLEKFSNDSIIVGYISDGNERE
ncbi:hypothetical protein NFI96_002000 [Prochilodus magdalenae]|nr:hypothetical protein NFI96_002000 [Prochilodus magdalenae]